MKIDTSTLFIISLFVLGIQLYRHYFRYKNNGFIITCLVTFPLWAVIFLFVVPVIFNSPIEPFVIPFYLLIFSPDFIKIVKWQGLKYLYKSLANVVKEIKRKISKLSEG